MATAADIGRPPLYDAETVVVPVNRLEVCFTVPSTAIGDGGYGDRQTRGDKDTEANRDKRIERI